MNIKSEFVEKTQQELQTVTRWASFLFNLEIYVTGKFISKLAIFSYLYDMTRNNLISNENL